MEFFILGVICAVIGFLVVWFTGKNIKPIIWYAFTLPIVITLVVGLFQMYAAPSEDVDKIFRETISSMVEHWEKHLLFDLGGYAVGVIIGCRVKNHSVVN